jgi:hypothetical protein
MGKLFTGSEILLESLRREKVEVVFGLPGGVGSARAPQPWRACKPGRWRLTPSFPLQ